MRLLRALLVLLLLLLIAVGVAVWQAPRWVDTPRVRAYLEEQATARLGREVTYASLGLGLVPPRLVVAQARVAGSDEAAPDLLVADELGVELSLDALLARTLEVSAVHVTAATLHLVRDERGLQWPGRPQDEGREDDGVGGDEPDPPPAPPPLGVVHLEDVALVVEDRAARRGPVTWRVEGLAGEASAPGREAAAFTLRGDLASGGSLAARGTWNPEGMLALTVDLDGFDPGPANAYLAPRRAIAGRLSGQVDVSGPVNRPDHIAAKLSLADGEVTFQDFVLRGPMTLETTLEGAPLTGRFDFDATEAALDYRIGTFTKPPGTPGTATGRILRDEQGRLAIDDVRVLIRNLDARGRLETGPRTRFDLAAGRFDIGPFGELVAALRERHYAGPVSVPALTLWSKPFELDGTLMLEGVRVPVGERGVLELHGALHAVDGQLVAEGARARVSDQVCRVDFTLLDLQGERPYQLRLRADGADTEALTRGLTGESGRLSGPITFDARLRGLGRAGRPTLGTLAGEVSIDVGPGRIEGTSLLKVVFEKLGLLGRAAFRAGGMLGADALIPFYDDDYESIHGRFQVAEGVARTDDLVIQRPTHRFDLRGTFGLADRHVDATGVLTIGEKLDAVLSRVAGREVRPARIQRLEIAHIGGTLDAPEVEISKAAALAFLGLYSITGLIDRIGGGLGEAVIEGAERVFGDGAEDDAPEAEAEAP